jgi:uncharacterized membrane protein YhaH (DUF805 family)
MKSPRISPPISSDAHAAPNLDQIEKIDDTFDAVGLSCLAAVFLYTEVVTLFVKDAPALPVAVLIALIAIGFLVLISSVTVRRLHDLNWTGYLALVLVIPYLNLLFILFLVAKTGSDGANKFGNVNTHFRFREIYRGS